MKWQCCWFRTMCIYFYRIIHEPRQLDSMAQLLNAKCQSPWLNLVGLWLLRLLIFMQNSAVNGKNNFASQNYETKKYRTQNDKTRNNLLRAFPLMFERTVRVMHLCKIFIVGCRYWLTSNSIFILSEIEDGWCGPKQCT